MGFPQKTQEQRLFFRFKKCYFLIFKNPGDVLHYSQHFAGTGSIPKYRSSMEKKKTKPLGSSGRLLGQDPAGGSLSSKHQELLRAPISHPRAHHQHFHGQKPPGSSSTGVLLIFKAVLSSPEVLHLPMTNQPRVTCADAGRCFYAWVRVLGASAPHSPPRKHLYSPPRLHCE